MRITIVFPLLLIFSTLIFGQTADKKGDRGFEVPSRYISVLLVNDPKCPIQLSGPTTVIGWSSGGLLLGFNIQNVSDANVDSFVVEETDWVNAHGYNVPFTVNKNMFFVPLMTVSSLFEDEDAENLVAFDEKKAGDAIRLGNKIWIAMVVNVKLSNGTTYDASKKYAELTEFLSDLKHRTSTRALEGREQKVRQFVSKLFPSGN